MQAFDGPVAGWVLSAPGPVKRASRFARHGQFDQVPFGWKRREGEGFAPWCAGAPEGVVDRWLVDRWLGIVEARAFCAFAEFAGGMPFQLAGLGTLLWSVRRGRYVELHRFPVE